MHVLASGFSSILFSVHMQKLRSFQDSAARTAPHGAVLKAGSCANRRGLGQMFPFTNTAKEPGLPSSLPWRYLHFITSSNNHATSSLKKGKYSAAGKRFTISLVEKAKCSAFFNSNSETSPCLILPTVIQTAASRRRSQDSLQLITCQCYFARGCAHTIASGPQGMDNCAVHEPPQLSPSFSKINGFLS